ncbi:MAG: JDVT-CTERM system CAAX-type protease [Zetaproteobacteria bacterium]|nr:JDVT-CTERM system CAAX-type protease [Zetaproteobacteria bacterium]
MFFAISAAITIWTLLYIYDHPNLGITWGFQRPLLFISIIFIQPILEELLFRGALQGWLINQPWASTTWLHISLANLMTSMLFSLLHIFAHPPLISALVFIPSLIFGHFRDRYHGWLIPSISLHIFYNLGYFFLYPPS